MYSRRIKKLVAFIVSGLIIISIFSGCVVKDTNKDDKTPQQTTDKTPDTSNEPIKLSMLFAHAGIEFKKPTMFQEVIKDKFNIEIEYVEVPPNNFEKVEILFATGEYPEFLPQFWETQQIINYRREKLLLPLDSIFDKIPNYRKRYNDAEWEEMLKMTAYKGEHHWLPVKNFRNASQGWVYKKSVFDSLGLQPPKTTDEMYDTLMKIKKEKVKDLIFAQRYDTLYSIMLAHGTTYGRWVNPITNKFELGPDTPQFKEALKFSRKLYKSGLIAEDFPTWTQTQFDNAVGKNQIVYALGYSGDPANFQKYSAETDPDAKWAISPYYLKADADKSALFIKEQPWFTWGIAFTDKMPIEKLEKVAPMIDWFSTREGNDFLWLGPEGVTYDIVGDYYVFKDKFMDPKDETGHTALMWKPFQEEGFLCNTIAYTNYVVFGQTDLGFGPARQLKKGPNDILWDDYITPQIDRLVYAPFYRMDYTPTEEKNNANWGTTINDIIEKYMYAFTMQEDLDPANDADWNKFMEELNKAKFQEYKTMLQAVYERSN